MDADECIFSDDSAGNIALAEGKCDTLAIVKREGIDATDMAYLEFRAWFRGNRRKCWINPKKKKGTKKGSKKGSKKGRRLGEF